MTINSLQTSDIITYLHQVKEETKIISEINEKLEHLTKIKSFFQSESDYNNFSLLSQIHLISLQTKKNGGIYKHQNN